MFYKVIYRRRIIIKNSFCVFWGEIIYKKTLEAKLKP